jgi:hypothetical protein
MIWCWRAVLLLARFLFLSGSEILVRLGATSFLLASRVRGAPRGGDSRDIGWGGPSRPRVRPDEVYFHRIIHPHTSPRQVHDVHNASTPL